jgi:hypothetical protein
MKSIGTLPMIEANPGNIRLLRKLIDHQSWHTAERTLVGFVSGAGRRFAI